MKLRNEPRQPQQSPTRKAWAVVPEKDGLSPAVDVKYLKPFENCVELYICSIFNREVDHDFNFACDRFILRFVNAH